MGCSHLLVVVIVRAEMRFQLRGGVVLLVADLQVPKHEHRSHVHGTTGARVVMRVLLHRQKLRELLDVIGVSALSVHKQQLLDCSAIILYRACMNGTVMMQRQ